MSALPYNKISCSLNNSAAIGENGEIYVWGSGKYGLTYSIDTETRVNYNSQYKTLKKFETHYFYSFLSFRPFLAISTFKKSTNFMRRFTFPAVYTTWLRL